MIFNIVGINDQRILTALQRLLNAFNKSYKISALQYDYLITIIMIEYEKEIKVIIKAQGVTSENRDIITNDRFYDLKYLVLGCFYQLLVKVTGKRLSYGVLTGIRPTKLVHKYKKRYNDHEVWTILQKKYLVSSDKANLLINIVNHQSDLLGDISEYQNEVSIYINIPFCLSKCSYCSFASYPYDNKSVTRNDYLNTLFKEIKYMGKYLSSVKIPITTIYVGGGTPTALSSIELKALLMIIDRYLLSDKVKEYTLECGRPDSLDDDKLEIIKRAKVSRISINPQTFKEATLQKVNRKHTISDIENIYFKARNYGLTNINMDLIIGLPGEQLTDFKHSIDATLLLNPESITIHYLAQKRGAQLYNADLDTEKSEYVAAFNYAYNRLTECNYNPYYLYRQKYIVGNLENIGYARKGYESVYNMLMIEEAQNIIGLGCGSSSKFINYDIILSPKNLLTYLESYQDYLNKKIKAIRNTLRK